MAVVLLGGQTAFAAAPPAAPAVLAKGISDAFLVGVDDRYVYWTEAAAGGTAGQSAHRLRRVAKQGGAPETLTELPREPEEMCGGAVVRGRAFFVVGGENQFDPAWQIVAVDTAKPGAPAPIGKPRSSLCQLVVEGNRLYWEDEEMNGGVWSAALDGSGMKQLWKTPDKGRVERLAMRGRDLVFLTWRQLPRPEEGSGMGLGNFGNLGRLGHGKLGEDPSNTEEVFLIPPGGKARSIWQGPQHPSDIAADGADVALCTNHGIIRVAGAPLGAASKPVASCKGELRLWQGWYFTVEGDSDDAAALVGRKVSAPAQPVQILPNIYGGANNLVFDADAIYACAAATKPDVCDLVRAPGPASLDHLPGGAKPAKP